MHGNITTRPVWPLQALPDVRETTQAGGFVAGFALSSLGLEERNAAPPVAVRYQNACQAFLPGPANSSRDTWYFLTALRFRV
jgi:hypothetical protein